MKVKVQWLGCAQLFPIPWTIAHQVPLSMGFSRQGYRSGYPFPSPGDLPDPGIEPGSPTLHADSLPSEPLGKNIVFPLPVLGLLVEALQIRLAKDRSTRQKWSLLFLTCTHPYTRKNSVMNNSKEWLELGFIQLINRKAMHLYGREKTKKTGIRLPRAVNCGKVIILGNNWKTKDLLDLLCRFLWCHLWVIKI